MRVSRRKNLRTNEMSVKENKREEGLEIEKQKEILYYAEMIRAHVNTGLFRDFIVLVMNAIIFMISINEISDAVLLDIEMPLIYAITGIVSTIAIITVLIIQDENKKYIRDILLNRDDEIINKRERELKILDKISFLSTMFGMIVMILSTF